MDDFYADHGGADANLDDDILEERLITRQNEGSGDDDLETEQKLYEF